MRNKKTTAVILISLRLFCCYATVENPRFYRGKKKA